MNVDEFIFGLDGQQKAIVSFLHHHLRENFNLYSKINWKIPTYYRKSWVCYLNPIKADGVELAFIRGKSLANTQMLLKSKGRKQVCGIDFYSVETIDLPLVNEIIHEALLLDEVSKR